VTHPDRRGFLAAGALSVVAGALGALAAGLRLLVPRVSYEPKSRFPVGRPEEFPPGATFLPERRLFVIRSPDGFHAVSSVCTHLGCNVGQRARGGLACPCHGSVFDADGTLVEGPAGASLTCYGIGLDRRGELFVDRERIVTPDSRLEV
jgi:cytochrome b6-f complex iron-sulfur subunit